MKSRYKLLMATLFCLVFFPLKTVYGASTDYALKFSSDSAFTLSTYQTWDGTLEYSIDNGTTWNEWDGTELSGTSTQSIYVRGTGNSSLGSTLDFTGKYCIGNIENLLDYNKVKNGEHPEMGEYCFSGLFSYCSTLEQAPDLPATTLAPHCYGGDTWDGELGMFWGCTSLKQAPELPATELADYCYVYMFYNCTSLEEAPELSATTLADYCYDGMFEDCTSLEQAPELPATELAYGCYDGMFMGCTSLEQAPELPATILAGECYENMFDGCTSLQEAPALPATTLANSCYDGMFRYCTSLEKIPILPATVLVDFCYNWMFYDCSSLRISEEQTDEYKYEYIIAKDGTSASYALNYMFEGTGGTFTGTSEINTTYYLMYPPIIASPKSTNTEKTISNKHITPAEIKCNTPNTTKDDIDKKSECEIIANVYYAYYVSMPASLILSPSETNDVYECDYKVKAKTKTDGLAGKYIKVEPDSATDLTKDDGTSVTLYIDQDKKYFGSENSSDIEKVKADKWSEIAGKVNATITDQGEYKGNFKFEYGLVDSVD